MRTLTLLSFFGLILFSCNRKEFKEYTGKYQGNEGIHVWAAGEVKEYNITPGQSLEVTKNGRYINLVSEKIHIKDIEPGKTYYQGEGKDFFTLTFKNDSIYFSSTSDQAESGSSYSFIGAKVD